MKRPAEAGFSVVELCVVMLIVAVLMGIAINMLHGTKDDGAKGAAKEVARSYYEAAMDFAVDNGGAVPKPATEDWPKTDIMRGPVDHLNRNPDHRYMRKQPEALKDGRVRFGATFSPAADPSSSTGKLMSAKKHSFGHDNAPTEVRYEIVSPTVFRIVVAFRDHGASDTDAGSTAKPAKGGKGGAKAAKGGGDGEFVDICHLTNGPTTSTLPDC